MKNQKVLYGTFYVPPSSPAAVWLSLVYSIEPSLNCNADAVIVVGDFNDYLQFFMCFFLGNRLI